MTRSLHTAAQKIQINGWTFEKLKANQMCHLAWNFIKIETFEKPHRGLQCFTSYLTQGVKPIMGFTVHYGEDFGFCQYYYMVNPTIDLRQ